MQISPATDQQAWDSFLASQPFRPFLQSWTMGEVYGDIGQEPVRLQVEENDKIVCTCFGHVVPAKRGKHLSIPYGPAIACGQWAAVGAPLVQALREAAASHGCSFIRMSPFWPVTSDCEPPAGSRPSPMHLLAEHVWYLPLTVGGQWWGGGTQARTEDEIFKNFRATHRNLIRRAEKEGVTVTASDDPNRDIVHFLRLHEETRRRHGFTPYTEAFFRAQVRRFSAQKQCGLYLARYQNEIISTSIHIHAFGETSYHHGASASAFSKVPASYLLQWTAIRDAIRSGDHVYNFWGVAPTDAGKSHPFAGVTLFKTGFGGSLLELTHSRDIPLTWKYWLTRGIETVRRWKRGF